MTVLMGTAFSAEVNSRAEDVLYRHGLNMPRQPADHSGTVGEFFDKMERMYSSAHNEVSFEQVAPGRAWLAPVSQFIVENALLSPWGWFLRSNLRFVEFMAEYEPDVKFLFLYRSLADDFADHSADVELTTDSANAFIGEWILFHRQMLQLHSKLRDRSVLLRLGASSALNDGNIAVLGASRTKDLPGLPKLMETDFSTTFGEVIGQIVLPGAVGYQDSEALSARLDDVAANTNGLGLVADDSQDQFSRMLRMLSAIKPQDPNTHKKSEELKRQILSNQLLREQLRQTTEEANRYFVLYQRAVKPPRPSSVPSETPIATVKPVKPALASNPASGAVPSTVQPSVRMKGVRLFDDGSSGNTLLFNLVADIDHKELMKIRKGHIQLWAAGGAKSISVRLSEAHALRFAKVYGQSLEKDDHGAFLRFGITTDGVEYVPNKIGDQAKVMLDGVVARLFDDAILARLDKKTHQAISQFKCG